MRVSETNPVGSWTWLLLSAFLGSLLLRGLVASRPTKRNHGAGQCVVRRHAHPASPDTSRARRCQLQFPHSFFWRLSIDWKLADRGAAREKKEDPTAGSLCWRQGARSGNAVLISSRT